MAGQSLVPNHDREQVEQPISPRPIDKSHCGVGVQDELHQHFCLHFYAKDFSGEFRSSM